MSSDAWWYWTITSCDQLDMQTSIRMNAIFKFLDVHWLILFELSYLALSAYTAYSVIDS